MILMCSAVYFLARGGEGQGFERVERHSKIRSNLESKLLKDKSTFFKPVLKQQSKNVLI